jgi:hypothetical protein
MTIKLIDLNPKSKHIKYVFRYNMNDMIDNIHIYDDKDKDVKFNIFYIDKLIEKYGKIRDDILIKEKKIDRKENFINFMESYYLNKEKINQLIKNIAQIRQKKAEPWYSGGSYLNPEFLDVDGDYSKWKFISPLKEVYEFYQFCRSYFTGDRKQYIDKILSDDGSLIQMEKARNIIIDIQKNYS